MSICLRRSSMDREAGVRMMGTMAEAPSSIRRDRDRSTTVFPGKYLSLTSYRPDGTPVATPVWFVQDGERVLVETDATSYKVKRIRRFPKVSIAPCSASGRLRSDPVAAVAEVLGPEALEPVRRQMRRKYQFDRMLALPLYRAIQAIRGKPVRGERPVILAITPI
jgi:uncharacterized protein